MAGTGTDPGATLDVPEILSGFFRDEMPKIAADVTRQVLAAQASTEHATRTFVLTANMPVLLLGYDRARTRSLLRATAAEVYIGTPEQLAGGLGYMLPTQAGDEIKTIQEVYVAYLPAGVPASDVRVFAWNERRV